MWSILGESDMHYDYEFRKVFDDEGNEKSSISAHFQSENALICSIFAHFFSNIYDLLIISRSCWGWGSVPELQS